MSSLAYASPNEPTTLNYNVGIRNVRAIVTSKWNGGGYTPKVIREIESYYIDTSLDNDTDPWQIEIGDPNGDLLDVLDRNNEVRMQIFGVGSTSKSLPAMTGLTDEIEYGDDGILRFTGRDLSSIAVDSTAPPGFFRHVKAWRVVEQQAKALGFKKTDLATTGPFGPIVKKLMVTDGSESYWEFWHRMYRKEQMWIWTQPDGMLIAGKLNYEAPADYFFGTPRRTDSKKTALKYIPVERFQITSSKNQRYGDVWVYGHKGDTGITVKTTDPTTAGWIKRPNKIMFDTEAHTPKAAQKIAWEEIFESKVGAVEYSITVPDPGFEIHQNRTCVLSLNNPDIHGEFFVVGVRRQLGPDGFVQEIRLRERQYAISRRIPQDPKLKNSSEPSKGTQEAGFAQGIAGVADFPQPWASFFIKAANAYHGPWDYNLFLATLIGISDQETGFTNERSNGGPGGDHHEWTPPPSGSTVGGSHGDTGGSPVNLEEWKTQFANNAGDGYVSTEFAVGPMQLYTRGNKEAADDLMKQGYHDEFQGGRWHPEHNIMIAASILRASLKGMSGDSGRDIDMWQGVMAYNLGIAGARAALASDGKISDYAQGVKSKVLTSPGYLPSVKDARDQANTDAKAAANDTSATDPGNRVVPTSGWHNSPQQLGSLLWVKKVSSRVDLEHVDFQLLTKVNSLGSALGKVIGIRSGYRYTGNPGDGPGAAPNGGDTQWYLYDQYVAHHFDIHYIAAKPHTSNHEKGEAVDAEINGVPISVAVPASTLAIYGLHCPVSGDLPHMTLLGVDG